MAEAKKCWLMCVCVHVCVCVDVCTSVCVVVVSVHSNQASQQLCGVSGDYEVSMSYKERLWSSCLESTISSCLSYLTMCIGKSKTF